MRRLIIIVLLMMGCRDGGGSTETATEAEWLETCRTMEHTACDCYGLEECPRADNCERYWTELGEAGGAACLEADRLLSLCRLDAEDCDDVWTASRCAYEEADRITLCGM